MSRSPTLLILLSTLLLSLGSVRAAAPAAVGSLIMTPVSSTTAPKALPLPQLGALPIPSADLLAAPSVAISTNKTASRAERRAARKEFRASVKSFRKALRHSSAVDDDRILLIVLALFIPPLAMYLYEDDWTSRVTLNLILTLLCGLPGIVHALIIIGGRK